MGQGKEWAQSEDKVVVDLDKWGEHKVNMITDISVFKEVRRYRLQVMKARAKECIMNNCFHWRALHNDFGWQAQFSNVCSDVCVSLEWAAPADTCLSLVCHLFVTFPPLLLPNAWDTSVLWIGMPSMPKPMPCGNAYYARHDNNVSYPPGHVMGLVYRLQLIILPKMDQDESR